MTVSNLGIREHECISLTEVKCEFFGISCRVPGAMSMIANMFRALTEAEAERLAPVESMAD